ncbi:MAG: Fic family protein [Dehalococcoidia bacterium]|nr:Fic family protein [Dehalococcoidia bacterium]
MLRRFSKLKGSALGSLPELTPEQIDELELANGLRQYDRMMSLIEESIRPGASFKLRPSSISELNRLAVEGLEPGPGSYRTFEMEIEGSQHEPPPWRNVPDLVERMCDYVNENWASATPIHLAAYVMWRLNWIHPFTNGNGRTSRAVSYLVLCVKLNSLLPGRPAIPEAIAGAKNEYYAALDAADAAARKDLLDVSKMEALLGGHLASQLLSVVEGATGTPLAPQG